MSSLTKVARELDIPGATGMRKQELIFEILKARAEKTKPDHIAKLISFLGTDAAAKVSGQIFGVRGNEVYLYNQPRPIRIMGDDQTNTLLVASSPGNIEAIREELAREGVDVRGVKTDPERLTALGFDFFNLATASKAVIVGFNVRPDRQVRELAATEDVEIRTYEVIYHLLEDIEAAMVGMLAPEFEEVVTGEAEVREIFSVPRVGKIAGCYVTNGTITRGSKVRFLRDGTIIWKGAISSLRRFKDDVREVNQGFECGIGLTDFQDLKDGDIIETYEDREIPRT